MNKYYPHLFQPLRINNMMIKNRIISSIMGIPQSHKLLSSVNYGNVSLFDKAAGGAAMDFVSIECSADENYEYPKHDRDVIRESISVARQYGAKVGAWIRPVLMCAGDELLTHYAGGVVYAPSAYLTKSGKEAIPLTKEQIRQIMVQVARDALAAKKFGFDFVYLYLGYEELPGQFLSPLFNHRTDEYGGILENRIRFADEYASAVRNAVGKDYPVVSLVSASDGLPESFEFDDVVGMLEKVKDKVDLFNVSRGMDMVPGYFKEDGIIDPSKGNLDWYQVNGLHCQSIYEPEMTNVEYAKKIKKAFPDKLVSCVGSIMTPEDAEKLIAEGAVDCVTMGRPLNADPYLPRKAMTGKSEDIVPCIRCLYCYHTATEHTNTQCSVNPRYRRENRVPLKVEKADEIRKVVVVGGGPAGCRAALTASERGHQVILLEQSDSLGGQLKLAAFESDKKELFRYKKWMETQVKKHDIEVHFNTKATPEVLEGLHPDVVLVCIGGEPIDPRFPGRDLKNVYRFDEYLTKGDDDSQKVAVIGGGMVGAELTVELLHRGKEVTVIEMGSEIAAQGNMLYKIGLNNQLKKYEKQLHIMTETKCMGFEEDGVLVETEGNTVKVPCDTSIIAVGMRSKREEAFSLYGVADETMMIGDCEKVGQVIHATNDAYFIASNI